MSTTSSTKSRPASDASSLMQDVPGAFPASPVTSTYQSLSQAVHAKRAEYTRPKDVRIKVGSWNVASFKGTEKDIGGWFVEGKGVAEALAGLNLRSLDETHQDNKLTGSAMDDREDVAAQEARHTKGQPTIPKNDPGSLPGCEEVGLYVLGLQEIIDINSPSEALRPFTDPGPSNKWKSAVAAALPSGYQLVAEQQLIGLLLLVYAAPSIASEIRSVSTTSVGTGVMGYMGNKGAVTARIVLGQTTRLVFINSHLAAGADKASLERRNWDVAQIIGRTKFLPINDSTDLNQSTGEVIGDEDVAFWFGDLNYRLEGIPPDDVRRLLMLHTRNEYDLSKRSAQKVESEISQSTASIKRRQEERSSLDSTYPSFSGAEPDTELDLDPSSDPASLQTTLAPLLPHDELHQQQAARKAFHDGWQEGPIKFLPTYKYDVGSVGVFDSSEKKRGPSWCDRILYRTRRDKLAYDSKIQEEEEARRRDAEMKASGADQAAADEEVLYDYDPGTDAADDQETSDEDEDTPSHVIITKEGFRDELDLEYYTSHQRVLSSDHKPLDAVFTLKYDAVVPELKAKVQQEVARELDKAENEGRPNVTIVVDRHHSSEPESTDEDLANFEGVSFGDIRFSHAKRRSITIANTGHVPATVGFVDRPVGPGQTEGICPTWIHLHVDTPGNSERLSRTEGGKMYHLEPGDACNVELVARVHDMQLIRALNEGMKTLDDILVLRVENGRDHFLPVHGKWLDSSLGRSIDKLIRIPEGGIRKLQHQRPDGSRGKHMSNQENPVKWSAPRELFRLTEAVEDLIERAVAEWDMTGQPDEKPPWERVAGWPFAEESWILSDTKERQSAVADVVEALDTDSSFDSTFSPGMTPVQRIEILAETLLLFLRYLPDGVVTEQLWSQLDTAHRENEKAKKHPTAEEEQTQIQEIMSQSACHSITFILITSMLDRIATEVTATAEASASPKKVTDLLQSAHPRATVRKKTLSQIPRVAKKQIVSRALAAVMADCMIRAPVPSKERDKGAVEERKIRMIEVFLMRDDGR
ncbi:hypothetical protein LTR28_000965 [Elasticomyces elasticus]|nr:hypothetical protein LTR28_000965 [Elasticomyces elasticus]